MSAAATARLEARISPELHAQLKRAAELQGRTLPISSWPPCRTPRSAPSSRLKCCGCRWPIRSASRRRCCRRPSLHRRCSAPSSVGAACCATAHDRSAFASGSAPLDRYLREEVTQDTAAAWRRASGRDR